MSHMEHGHGVRIPKLAVRNRTLDGPSPNESLSTSFPWHREDSEDAITINTSCPATPGSGRFPSYQKTPSLRTTGSGCSRPTTSSTTASRGSSKPQGKKKQKGGLMFGLLTLKEPSLSALDQFAAQQRQQAREKRSGDFLAGGGFKPPSKKLPPTLPRTNSKWDGLPECLSKANSSQNLASSAKSVNGRPSLRSVGKSFDTLSSRGTNGPASSYPVPSMLQTGSHASLSAPPASPGLASLRSGYSGASSVIPPGWDVIPHGEKSGPTTSQSDISLAGLATPDEPPKTQPEAELEVPPARSANFSRLRPNAPTSIPIPPKEDLRWTRPAIHLVRPEDSHTPKSPADSKISSLDFGFRSDAVKGWNGADAEEPVDLTRSSTDSRREDQSTTQPATGPDQTTCRPGTLNGEQVAEGMLATEVYPYTGYLPDPKELSRGQVASPVVEDSSSQRPSEPTKAWKDPSNPPSGFYGTVEVLERPPIPPIPQDDGRSSARWRGLLLRNREKTTPDQEDTDVDQPASARKRKNSLMTIFRK